MNTADSTSIDLRTLVAHSYSVQQTLSLEATSTLANKKSRDFLAVMDGEQVIGLYSSRKCSHLLSARFGHAVYASRAIREFMVEEPLIIHRSTDLPIALKQVFNRRSEYFFDDIILVDDNHTLIGLISTDSLVRLQHRLHVEKLQETEDQRTRLEFKNAQLEDLTERLENANAELTNARNIAVQATKLKSEFLANMSHEIRTPMNGVIGMLSLLAESELDEDQEEYMRIAETSANALLRVINDILDFSKIEAGKLDIKNESLDLNELIDCCVKLYQERARSKGIQLSASLCPFDDLCVGDPIRIQQIINNLISNAIKFTDQGSVVVKSSIASYDEDIYKIRISVTDTGIGIEESKLSQLFQPFVQADGSYTRQAGGTGLGLSISNRLAELMGSSIHCESIEGEGSTFHMTLPLKKSVRSATAQTSPSPPGIRRDTANFQNTGTRVLVVEDHAVNRQVARRFLEHLNCEVTLAVNGQDAIRCLSEHDFDIIFMDCQMPVMDGYTATRKIRGGACGPHKRELFISAMTAHAMPEERENCLEAGMDAFVSKPVRLQDLEAIMDRYRSRRSGLPDPEAITGPKIQTGQASA